MSAELLTAPEATTTTAHRALRVVTAPTNDPASRRDRRVARVTYGLNELFSLRPELKGVHAPADWVGELTTWCA